MTKFAREIMEILESFDLTCCHWSAGALAGCDPKTVARYVAIRDTGADLHVHARRPRLIDPSLEKIEELVERPPAPSAPTRSTIGSWSSALPATSAPPAGRRGRGTEELEHHRPAVWGRTALAIATRP